MNRPIAHSLIKALRKVPGFEILDEDDLVEIVGASVNLVWPAGSCVFAKDSPGEALYIVLTGKVRIYDVVDGKRIEIAEAGPGGFFGEMSLLLEAVHTKHAEAAEDSELLVLMKEPFRKLLERNPDLDSHFRTTLETRRAELKAMYTTDAAS